MLENIVLIADRDLIGVMIVHKERRDRHLQKLDREQHHEELEECKVSDKARERFQRPPYQITDAAGYIAKKYDIKKEMEP